MITVKVDQSGCIGCGLCADICPEVFRMGDDGLADTYGEVTENSLASATSAKDSCPVNVITLKDL